MKGQEHQLVELLKGDKTCFRIPVYQRNYTWTKEQCDQLFDDLEEIVKQRLESHFFGSIVYQTEGIGTCVIIDGQQRIVTSILLLLALINQIRAGNINCDNVSLANKIENDYLTYTFQKDEYKLKLNDDDQAAYIAISNGKTPQTSSNVLENYNHFLKRLNDTKLTAKELLQAIEKLIVIDINVEASDNAQRIFESLNATGLALTEGDKIRNLLLMDLEVDEQDRYYQQYWRTIEKNTNSDVSAFIRNWLTAVRNSTPKIDKVYTEFKDYIKTSRPDTEELLDELLRYSDYYYQMKTACSDSPEVDAVLRRLEMLDLTVVYPFMLNLFEYWHNGSLDDSEVATCLRSIEIYLFRRWVCQLPTNAHSRIFETLHSEIKRGEAEGGTYSDVMNHILLSKQGGSRFPTDTEFIAGFDQRDFYHINDYKYYLFDRLEREDNLERIDVAKGMHEGTYSVEHIMPQHLSSKWRSDLGKRADTIHETWLHKMANLTLTAYNSPYSNRRFIEKRNLEEKGFKESGLHLNQYIAEQTKWGEKELKERNTRLQKQFLKLWPSIESSFTWSHNNLEEHALDDEFEFSGRKIHAFTFMGTKYLTKSWADMMLRVMGLIYDSNPTAFNKYLPDDTGFPAHYFFAHKHNNNVRIGQGVYLKTNSSTNTKIEILKAILKEANIDPSELIFEVYKEKDEED